MRNLVLTVVVGDAVVTLDAIWTTKISTSKHSAISENPSVLLIGFRCLSYCWCSRCYCCHCYCVVAFVAFAVTAAVDVVAVLYLVLRPLESLLAFGQWCWLCTGLGFCFFVGCGLVAELVLLLQECVCVCVFSDSIDGCDGRWPCTGLVFVCF